MSPTSKEHRQTNKSLLSKIFGHKLNPTADYPAADDSASTTSGATTLVEERPAKSVSGEGQAPWEQTPPLSKDEQTTFGDLMAKANTMAPDEFKAYMAAHKEEVDAAQRRKSWARSWNYSKEFTDNDPL